jgi:predicted PurR-regulated permease PerM
MKYVEARRSATVAQILIIVTIFLGILNIIVLIVRLSTMTDQLNNYWKTSTKYIGNYRKIEIKENTLEKTVLI